MPHGMLDISMTVVVLKDPRIMTVAGQLEAAGMAEYMRMLWDWKRRIVARYNCPRKLRPAH